MYEVNILVNGNRCKQYNHDGNLFIEAKQNSEYVIEIKNNAWRRILAVCSIDGLDILNGKHAVQNGPGYIVNGRDSSKFDGFRVSDNKVAKFVFDYKNKSYAKSKGDGSEKNVGVIGVRLFEEKFVPIPPPTEIHHHNYKKLSYLPHDPWDVTYTTSCDSLGVGETPYNTCGNTPVGDSSAKYSSDQKLNSSAGGILRGFDMGTKWGEAKESHVVEVEFDRGNLCLTTNIYYASRQSLIEMGVPLGNEKQVNFPKSFQDSKYARPPKNWKG
jgi:hypothetical protein